MDLATRKTGWIYGKVGTIPRPGLLILSKKGDRPEEAAAKLACWLRDHFEKFPVPDLVTMEHFLPAGAAFGRTTSVTREGQVGLSYVVRAVAACYGVPVRSPYPNQVRAHFVGCTSAAPNRGRGYKRTGADVDEDRAAMKALVIKRAQLLGYLPKDCHEDNMGDAAALFDWAASTFGRTSNNFALSSPKS